MLVILYNKYKARWLDQGEFVTVHNNNSYTITQEDIVVSWGCTARTAAKLTYNQPDAITLASNKAESRRVLLEAGLPVPSPSETDYPVIGRPARHYGGKRFFVCNNQEEVEAAKNNGCVYFAKLYPKTAEFRVHVASGGCLLVSRKTPVDSVVWNRASGSRFETVRWKDWPKTIVEIAIAAVNNLGLDFGAVDIMAFPTDDQPEAVVSEVNTAPGLSQYATGCYLLYFRWLAEFDYKPRAEYNLLKELRKCTST